MERKAPGGLLTKKLHTVSLSTTYKIRRPSWLRLCSAARSPVGTISENREARTGGTGSVESVVLFWLSHNKLGWVSGMYSLMKRRQLKSKWDLKRELMAIHGYSETIYIECQTRPWRGEALKKRGLGKKNKKARRKVLVLLFLLNSCNKIGSGWENNLNYRLL